MYPRATVKVVSLDGRSAYDNVGSASAVPWLVAFARGMYVRTSTYLWWDDAGRVHEIVQAEGVEQGDPLVPGLGLANTTR